MFYQTSIRVYRTISSCVPRPRYIYMIVHMSISSIVARACENVNWLKKLTVEDDDDIINTATYVVHYRKRTRREINNAYVPEARAHMYEHVCIQIHTNTYRNIEPHGKRKICVHQWSLTNKRKIYYTILSLKRGI